MEQQIISILHFEDNPGDAVMIRDVLEDVGNIDFRIKLSERLNDGLRQLTHSNTDIILLDLNLPDSKGIVTFEEVKKAAGNTPIIIMSGLSDENLALKAVKQGAQDYLVKGQVDANLLIRTILYGIERQKLWTELRQAIDQIRTLEGLLPICCYCKGIRDERGFVITSYSIHYTKLYDADLCLSCYRQCLRQILSATPGYPNPPGK